MTANPKEIERIMMRLDDDENVILSATQSRILPGGAALINPNTIYCTEKRVIIRNPIRLGYGENIEEYYYKDITNIRLEKGIFSASIVLFVRGMTEMSKMGRENIYWGRSVNGTIDALKKRPAEDIYKYIRERITRKQRK